MAAELLGKAATGMGGGGGGGGAGTPETGRDPAPPVVGIGGGGGGGGGQLDTLGRGGAAVSTLHWEEVAKSPASADSEEG